MIITRVFLLLVLLFCVQAAVEADLVAKVPGYGDDFKQKVWSGYLSTQDTARKIHYVLVESSSTAAAADIPLTLWLNGGPGCSSLLGFMQQIGPYYLEQGVHFNEGDKLVKNPYSWHTLSHLLFIQSPAGVGYSVNIDQKFSYTDRSTREDSMAALLDFFSKYPEYAANPFWIAGESYAGKYIPDLAVEIDIYNGGKSGKEVNLKGLLVGNGVMSFEGGTLEMNEMEFMVNHQFIDPDLIPYYRGSCLIDPESAGCRYFKLRYESNVDEINPYNVYSYCFYNDSFMGDPTESRKNTQTQATILKNIAKNSGVYSSAGKNGAPCAYFDGMVDYFKLYKKEYHAAEGKSWNGPCAEDITGKYQISLGGSMNEYRYLLNRLDKYHIVLYNGDWDDVVPYTDTMQNLAKLNLDESYLYTPFFVEDQHAGFIQLFDGVMFVLMKGASHQVPQSKRAEALYLFKISLEAHNGKADDLQRSLWE